MIVEVENFSNKFKQELKNHNSVNLVSLTEITKSSVSEHLCYMYELESNCVLKTVEVLNVNVTRLLIMIFQNNKPLIKKKILLEN